MIYGFTRIVTNQKIVQPNLGFFIFCLFYMSDFRVTKVNVKWEQIRQTLPSFLVSTGKLPGQMGNVWGSNPNGSSNFSEHFSFKKRLKNKNHHS